MAADYSFKAEIETLQRAVLAERLESVLRAGGRETARCGSQGRNAQLIEAYQCDKGKVQHFLYCLPESSHSLQCRPDAAQDSFYFVLNGLEINDFLA